MRNIRWGILGSGYIAGNFANGLRFARGCSLRAVASRRLTVAQQFAGEQGSQVRAYDDFAELVNDPEVDVVYVATPNECHVEHSLLAIEAGKPVLCEKPMALSCAEAEQIFDAARARDVFCMEGMWMRCSPALNQAISEIRAGAIGEPRLLASQIGYSNFASPESRLFSQPGGGALLDLGVYVVSLAQALFGMPTDISARAVIGPGDVDEQVTMLLSFDSDVQASLTASIRSLMRNDTTVHGTGGVMHLNEPVYFPQQYSIERTEPARFGSRPVPPSGLSGIKQSRVLEPAISRARELKAWLRSGRVLLRPHGTGLTAEAEEVARCLREDLKESPLVRHQDTLSVMQILDAVRHNWTHI